MKTKQEVKILLKEWMMSTIRSTQKKTASEGSGYHPSDIAFAFRNKLGIRMNETFILETLGMRKRNSGDRIKT